MDLPMNKKMSEDCPCSKAELCEPIKTGPRKEIFGFVTDKAWI